MGPVKEITSTESIRGIHFSPSGTHLAALKDLYNAMNQVGEDFHLKLMNTESNELELFITFWST